MGVEHNSRQVAKYLETHAALVGPGSPPEEPLGKKAKGSSRVPVTEKYHRFMNANRVAALFINPLIRQILASPARYQGIYLSEIVTVLYGDPAIVAKWENWKTTEDRRAHFAFKKLCRFVADLLRASHPDLELNVVVNPEDERVSNKREAAGKDKTLTAEESYTRLYDSFMDFCGKHDGTREELKDWYVASERERLRRTQLESVSKRTLERAISHSERGDNRET